MDGKASWCNKDLTDLGRQYISVYLPTWGLAMTLIIMKDAIK